MSRVPCFTAAGCDLCQQSLAEPSTRDRCEPCARAGSHLDSCTARVEFSGDAETWIHAFKYPNRGLAGLSPGPRAIAVALACDAATMSRAPRPDWIVPVPLHRNRLRARGFNPAATLAKAIARQTGARFATHVLLRRRDTPTQTNLGRDARRRNVRGAFTCPGRVESTVWLVDDVVTTGSTLEEAARCLRAAGARRVDAVCVARVRRTPEATAGLLGRKGDAAYPGSSAPRSRKSPRAVGRGPGVS